MTTIHRNRARFVLAAASLIALSQAPVAHAADKVASAAQPATSDAPEDTGTITVTAQRRTENLQNVPISVGVIKADDYADYKAAGSDSLLSLSGRVPSLYVESTTGRIFPRFYIRGLGNIDFYLGASQPVSIIQDDVVLEHVVLKSNPAYDIQQIEVLRGPQGSLFGRNTTAGIIKFDNAKPTKDWTGHVNASWGSYNSQEAEAAISGPIAKDGSVTFRLSGLHQHRDNWVTNTYTGPSADGTVGGSKTLGRFSENDGRFQIQFDPDPATSINLTTSYRDYSGTATLFYRGSIVKGSTAPNPTWNQKQVAYDEGGNNPQAYTTYGQTLHARHDFGTVSLTSITSLQHASGYSRGETDGGAAVNFPFNGAPNGYGESQGRLRGLDQWTEEVRLASSDKARLKWQVGGIYFDSRDDTEFDQRAFFLQGTANNPNNWVLLHDINTSWGIFGQASYQVTDAFSITGGVRETNDTKKTALLKTANTVANVSTYTGRTFVRLSDTKPSWDISAVYKLTPDLNVYARIARGFRGPTIQGRSAVFNADFTTANSETNTSYEAGLKSSFLNNAVHFNLTGFYYEVKNIQLNGNDSNGNGVLFNANKARGWGGEAELNAHVQNLTLNAGLSLLHTEIDDTNVYAQTCGLNGVQVCTVLNPQIVKGTGTGTAYYAQINGNPLPQAPKYNFNASARYDIPTKIGKFYVSTDWNLQGRTYFVPYKTIEFTSNNNFEGGAKIGWHNDHYDVAAYVRNLTNQHNLVGVIENYMAGVYNDPRIFGISLGIK
ncbi:MAG: TonB-dependent receptor [Sphingomonadales bacterium]|nr:TonB-dependent receptor [Sphingomonadales bacterium]MDE2168060.1 TonB-dependent receptor [Sphingomonadales bacterium]